MALRSASSRVPPSCRALKEEWCGPPAAEASCGPSSVGGQHTEALRSVLLACQPADSKDRLVRQGGQQLSRAGGAGAPGGGGLVVQLVPSSGQDHFHLEEAADTQSVLSLYVQKDFRYFLQHPYARLFVSYFVVFCNFLVFAEDPISHSRSESEIPVFGNVFSFMCTKYPPEWGWRAAKTLLWLLALLWGLVCGKLFIHHFLLRNLLRLKMFREEQGTWMIMLLTALLFVYALSLVYNTLLLSGHPRPEAFRINAQMGVTNASFMKVAACGTWLGDFLTAWMVTDMMLQDELYPGWAPSLRAFWQRHGRTRIVVFWAVALLLSALVVSLIVSDHISWDYLNREFVATTELSRAFLASFILVMDLLIVMQDWDFPHFVCDLNIKLPGLSAASFRYHMFRKYVHLPEIVFHISGNRTLWTLQYRQSELNPATNRSLAEDDIMMNSRYLGYPLSVKGLAFLPSLLGFAMFGALTYLYGRFPPKTDATAGGRLRPSFRSSWRQGSRAPARAPAPARLVVCWDPQCGAATRATTSDQLAAAKGAPPR
ncbi:transmembrane protein 117-like isoform X4 [Haemaphysalis longicornis]